MPKTVYMKDWRWLVEQIGDLQRQNVELRKRVAKLEEDREVSPGGRKGAELGDTSSAARGSS